MAVETLPTEAPPAATTVLAENPSDVPPPPESAPVAEESSDVKPAAAEEPPADSAIAPSVSFKEESNLVADLQDPEKKALDELKHLILSAIANNEFVPPPPPAKTEAVADEEPAAVEATPPATEEPATVPVEEEPAKVEEVAAPPAEEPTPPPPPSEDKAVIVEEDGAKTVEAIEETAVPAAAASPPTEEVFIWGVPLLGDEKSDTVLLKFLRARDFKVKDALAMINHAVVWRKTFGIDELLDSDLGVAPELAEKVVFMHGTDKEGHPVCYNVYGEFQDKDLYTKAFGDAEKRDKFLKWRIQLLEKGIRQKLDFSPGGISTMVQVTDLKNVAGPGKRELRQATKQALTLLQECYPEFAAKQIFINVPWWYLAYNRMISSVFTPRSKSKFVFAGPSRSAETLFKYIAPEQVPVQYGGLSKEDSDFTTEDVVTEVTIKPASKHTIEILATETSLLVWELRVLGWEVTYGAEFVPSSEEGYTVIVTKARKLVASDEPVVKESFKIGEPGKVVITIDNATSKKKKVIYRSKTKSTTE